MPTAAYATEGQLTAWLPTGTAATDGARLLIRASELLDGAVRASFAVDTVTDLPTDEAVATAMADACCAQAEFWLDVGEDHDVEGLAGARVSIGHLSLGRLPPELAPRARRILHTAGLLGSMAADTTAATFFATAGA